MSLVKRAIEVTFTLQSGTFQGTNSNTLTIPGLRVSMSVTQAGGVSSDASHIRIFGLSQSHMNQLSIYGSPTTQNHNNKISLRAGDAVSGMKQVFYGTIQTADATYNGENAYFDITAYCLLVERVKTIPATSYSGGADVATIMGQLAQQIGLQLENSGVSVKISNPHLFGSAIDQINELARQANINVYGDTIRGVLAIWPLSGARTAGQDSQVVQIGPQTGLVGYPTFGIKRVIFRTLYNAALIFGRKAQITSSLQPACGIWIPQQITTTLESETPDGAWFQDVMAVAEGTS